MWGSIPAGGMAGFVPSSPGTCAALLLGALLMPTPLLQTHIRDGGQKELSCCSGWGGTCEGQC